MICLVWVVNFTMPIFRPSFKPPAEINLAFMGVVGGLVSGYKSDNGSNRSQTTYTIESEPEPPTRSRKPAKKAAKKTATKTTKKAPAKKSTQRRQR